MTDLVHPSPYGAARKAVLEVLGWYDDRLRTGAPGADPYSRAGSDVVVGQRAHTAVLNSLSSVGPQLLERVASDYTALLAHLHGAGPAGAGPA
ncbi:hypothetical protein ABT160_25405 [Streptomyces sp. NPDC001941]|uniref:hypothetical protein n=1 Tax=Streptomyces sp. NPDC001941 TaxID=3154659 RepID=UPI003334196C